MRAAHCNQCGARLKGPSATKEDDGRSKLYADIAHPINAACREMIQQRVIQAFEEEKARSKLPGYVPSYDDFEPDLAGMPSPSRSATSTPHIQGAEKPHGPHKTPSHQPQPSVHRNGFGSGIFD
jgi:stage V sporulation protein G